MLVEDFEDAGSVVESTENSDTSLIRTNIDSLVFEGYGSGQIHLDNNNDFFEIMSAEFLPLNDLYNASMLEMNYRCDHSFKLGVAVKSAETGLIDLNESIQINPCEEWNKIYVHTTYQVNLGSSNDEFGIFIGTVKSPLSETASFYFDNIKWLQYQ